MRFNRTQKRQPPENTIPLINVVFLMLIFFLFAGSISKDDARELEPPLNILEDETIRSTGALIIDQEGKTHAGDQEIGVLDWVALREAEAEDGEPLKIAADGTLGADHLEKVLQELKTTGRTDIVLITRRGTQ
ncbi:biopolymer transporter ExbD [Labrenzia sp. PHM005]|uniref:ExbD/TolR family protein n=1 Tax=Labrenzia sp. PHM005 TaxID=2590016 RepID=UPI0011405FFE|nr:biopolymer transporter ExbD [Labrenzia sp. PHM005]QDG74976.1 biopolymer transporter ExbD [Labrenzia sp. PHM005]